MVSTTSPLQGLLGFSAGSKTCTFPCLLRILPKITALLIPAQMLQENAAGPSAQKG